MTCCGCCGSRNDPDDPSPPLVTHIQPSTWLAPALTPQGHPQHQMSSHQGLIPVTSALATIFELDPIPHFDLDTQKIEDDPQFFHGPLASLGLCAPCGDSLSSLYNAFQEFVHLLQEGSEVTKRLLKLQRQQRSHNPRFPVDPPAETKWKRGRPKKKVKTPPPSPEETAENEEDVLDYFGPDGLFMVKEEPLEGEEYDEGEYWTPWEEEVTAELGQGQGQTINHSDQEQDQVQEDEQNNAHDPLFVFTGPHSKVSTSRSKRSTRARAGQSTSHSMGYEEQEEEYSTQPEMDPTSYLDQEMKQEPQEYTHNDQEDDTLFSEPDPNPDFPQCLSSGTYPCPWPHCSKSFAHKKSCQRHYDASHLAWSVTCDFCQRSFNRSDKLLQHNRFVHGEGHLSATPTPIPPIPSSPTPSSPTKKRVRVRNQKKNQSSTSSPKVKSGHDLPRPHLCSFPGCGKAFRKRPKLKEHERIHGIGTKLSCSECGKEFNHHKSLWRHRKLCFTKTSSDNRHHSHPSINYSVS